MRRAALTAVQAGLPLLPVVLAFFSGAFFEERVCIAAICAWALLALAALAVPRAAAFRARAGRARCHPRARRAGGVDVDRGELVVEPAPAPTRSSSSRCCTCPALAAGALAWSDRRAARMVEPALAAGALVVIGYGLSGRLLPGVVAPARHRARGRAPGAAA